MSLENFLQYLQQILTMVNPQDEESIKLGRTALVTTVGLCFKSGMLSSKTYNVMRAAIEDYDSLVRNSYSFAGVPGQRIENQQKRRRLLNALHAGC